MCLVKLVVLGSVQQNKELTQFEVDIVLEFKSYFEKSLRDIKCMNGLMTALYILKYTHCKNCGVLCPPNEQHTIGGISHQPLKVCLAHLIWCARS